VELSNPQRDRYMAEACAKRSMAFVSRDAKALEYATNLGVRAVEPEAFAASILSRDRARVMFLKRLDAATILAIHDYVGHRLLRGMKTGEDVDKNDWLLRHLRDVIERYEGVWEWRWRDKYEVR
jgi:hypothetical protein